MKRGDVVLVQVPFVGAPGAKVRPALIVQCDPLHGMIRETIIAAITSNLSSAHQPHQLLIDLSTADGAASGLPPIPPFAASGSTRFPNRTCSGSSASSPTLSWLGSTRV